MSNPETSLKPELCLLSEFFRHSQRRNWWCENLGWIFMIALVTFSLLATLTAHFAKMNVMAMYLSGKIGNFAGGDAVTAELQEVFGYWGEPSWGFFQTFILPIATLFAFRFARTAGAALSELEIKKRIESDMLTVRLQHWNNVASRLICPLVFISLCFGCYYTQSKSFHAVSTLTRDAYTDESWDYGQTQSPFLGKLGQEFNGADVHSQMLFLRKHNQEKKLGEKLFAELRAKGHLDDPLIRPYVISDDEGNPKAIDLSQMSSNNSGVLKLSLQTTEYPETQKPAQHYAFLVAIITAQLLTAFGWTLVVWFMIKLACWLVVIFYALPTDDNPTSAQFKLLLIDPQKRFGLGSLFDPYTLVVFLIAIYGFYYALSLQGATGSSFLTSNGTGGSAASRLANLCALCVLVGSILIGPMFMFSLRVRSPRKARLDRIAKQCGETDDEKVLAVLLKEEQLVSSQSTWPLKDKWFRVALLAIAAFLVLPIADESHSLPKSLSTWANVPRSIRTSLPAFVARNSKPLAKPHSP